MCHKTGLSISVVNPDFSDSLNGDTTFILGPGVKCFMCSVHSVYS